MKPKSKFKLKPSESILISLVLLAVMGVFQVYWVKPNSKKMFEIQVKTAAIQKKIEESKSLIVSAGSRTPANEEAKTTQNLLERYVTSNTKFSKIITGIFNGSKDGGFSISKITAERSSAIGAYTQTLYNLQAESSFISIGRFLETLEDSPLLTEVESIDINRIENEMKKCRADIRIFGYVGGASK